MFFAYLVDSEFIPAGKEKKCKLTKSGLSLLYLLSFLLGNRYYSMDIFGLHLNRLLEDEFKTELRVRVRKDEDLAKVEFHNTSVPTGRTSLLCKFYLPIQNIPRAVSITIIG